MKKTSIIFLLVILLVLLGTTLSVAYLYSSAGNARIQAYAEKKIREQTGLPIAFHTFSLTRGHLYFIATLGHEASLGFDGRFDLFHRRLNGRYLLKAHHVQYRHYRLRQANIAGHIHGTIDDLKINGKGTLLDGPVTYALNVRHRIPQDIVIQLRKLPLDALLTLGGQPPIIHGQLNADILLPSIGRTGSKGHAIVQLEHARFDSKQIEKHYHYTLPKDKRDLTGQLRADLAGEHVRFDGRVLSDLITVRVQNGQANLTDKNVACDVTADTLELAPVTQNRLHGPFKLSGTFKYDAIGIQGQLASPSLGGKILLHYTKNIVANLHNVSMKSILHLIGQPDYAEGVLNGDVLLSSPRAQNGHYGLQLTHGIVYAAAWNKTTGMTLPANTAFTLRSKGTFTHGVLTGETHLVSRLLKASLTQTHINIDGKTGTTRYRFYIPNPLLLAGKKGKGIPVTVAGTATQSKTLRVVGSAKGLGKKLAFDYAADRLKVVAKSVAIGRVLASTGQPMALSGLADADIDLVSLKPLQGTLSLRAPDLKTYPVPMKQWIGTPLDTRLSVALSGRAKQGIVYANGDIKSPIMGLALPQIIFDTEDNALSTPFRLVLPELAKLEPIIGTKLNGPFTTHGTIRFGTQTNIHGTSTSLGGTLAYQYVGTQARLKVDGVPLIKLLHFANKPEQFLGSTHGVLRYNTATRKGQTRLLIDRFQFKPGKLTGGVKLLLHKDLAHIVYDRTTLDARINGDLIGYKIVAKGGRSVFAIRDGKLNTQTRMHQASFGLRIDNVDVIGTVKGPINDPKISVLPGQMLRSKVKSKVRAVVKKQLEKQVGAPAKRLVKKLPKLF